MLLFQPNKSNDCFYSLYRLVYRKRFERHNKLEEIPSNPKIDSMIQKLEDQISLTWYKKIDTFQKKYHPTVHLVDFTTFHPDWAPIQIVEHIKHLEPKDFYKSYVESLFEITDYDNDTLFKEKINECNRNNTFVDLPSLSTIKKLRKDSTAVRDELVEILTYYIPLYKTVESEVLALASESAEFFNRSFKNIGELLDTFNVIDSSIIEENSITSAFISVFIESTITFASKINNCYIVFGSNLTYLLSDEFKAKTQTNFYKCLADPTKQKILSLLADHKLCASDLVEQLGISKSTVSHHISQLTANSIIYLAQTEGKKLYYAVNTKIIEDMFQKTLAQYS